MNRLDLGVRRQCILTELPADSGLFVSAEGDAEVRVLRAVDLGASQ